MIKFDFCLIREVIELSGPMQFLCSKTFEKIERKTHSLKIDFLQEWINIEPLEDFVTQVFRNFQRRGRI